ncbi:MAG: hypothetical protein V3W04_05085 [Gammaproteobacteria bacterium]
MPDMQKLLPIVLLLVLSVALIPAASASLIDESDEDYFDLVPAKPVVLDTAQKQVSYGLNGFAQWLDSFFDNQRAIDEEATTRLRIKQSTVLTEGESIRLKLNVNLNIHLPNLKNEVNIFISGTDNEQINSGQVDTDSVSASDRDQNIGVQISPYVTRKKHVSLLAGIKLDSLEVFVGPRYRRTSNFDTWQTRFTQQLRWFSKKGWQATTRFDQERFISDRAFFRNTLEGRWRQEKSGYRINLNPRVVFRLGSSKALEYQLSNEFITHPVHRLSQSVFSVRYRQRFKRDWLFMELQPQLIFSHDNEYDPTPGFVLRFEVMLGGKQIKSGLIH